MDGWMDEKTRKANANVSNESCQVTGKLIFFNIRNEGWRIRIFHTRKLNTL